MEKEWKNVLREYAEKAKKEGIGAVILVEDEFKWIITGNIEKINDDGIKLYGSHLIPYEKIAQISFGDARLYKEQLYSSS